MKGALNQSSDQLQTSLGRQVSFKNATISKLGLTGGSFHGDPKTRKKHCRTKTDDQFPQHTISTVSTWADTRPRPGDKEGCRRVTSDVELKKVSSYRVLEGGAKVKTTSLYKSSNAGKNEHEILRSLQKLRKQAAKINPEAVCQQLKQIVNQDKKSGVPSSILNQCYLLNNQIIETIKSMKKKHEAELAAQKSSYQRKQHKLMRRVVQSQKKNQRCSALLNQLRLRNIDVDGIWQQYRLTTKNGDLLD